MGGEREGRGRGEGGEREGRGRGEGGEREGRGRGEGGEREERGRGRIVEGRDGERKILFVELPTATHIVKWNPLQILHESLPHTVHLLELFVLLCHYFQVLVEFTHLPFHLC